MKQRWAQLIFLEDAEKVLIKPLNLQKATLKYFNDNSIGEINIFLMKEIINSSDNLCSSNPEIGISCTSKIS
jgi:hypothetical protein